MVLEKQTYLTAVCYHTECINDNNKNIKLRDRWWSCINKKMSTGHIKHSESWLGCPVPMPLLRKCVAGNGYSASWYHCGRAA